MKYDAFIKAVQQQCRLPSHGDTVAAIRATLMTLAERLTAAECEDLAAQLTREIAFYLRQARTRADHKIKYDEFIQRIADRAGITFSEALFQARGVMSVVSASVSRGEIAQVRSQLPHDFAPLFEPFPQPSQEAPHAS